MRLSDDRLVIAKNACRRNGQDDRQGRGLILRKADCRHSCYCSGGGNFARDTGSSSARVPVGAATETVVEVSAKGYKNWFYSDPPNPSRPVLRLESGEERSLEVQLEPK